MPDLCYIQLNGQTKVLELQAGVYEGRQVFYVPLESGRRLRVAGSRPEEVIPQVKVIMARMEQGSAARALSAG